MPFFYVDPTSNQPRGPLSLDELCVLRQAGTIHNETLVIEEGNTDWRTCKDFIPALPSPPCALPFPPALLAPTDRPVPATLPISAGDAGLHSPHPWDEGTGRQLPQNPNFNQLPKGTESHGSNTMLSKLKKNKWILIGTLVLALGKGLFELFGDHDPNYLAGREVGQSMEYGIETKAASFPQARLVNHDSAFVTHRAESECPSELEGNSRQEWIKGFKSGYHY